MGRKPSKPRKLAPGQLALICHRCDGIVTRGSRFSEGYLTMESGRWLVYHDACRAVPNVVNAPVVRESRISSYPLLCNALASLAAELPGFRDTAWPELLRRIVADTEWYFDIDGGQKTPQQLIAANRAAYRMAGFSQKLSESRGA